MAPPLANLDAVLVGLILKLGAPDVTRHADVFSLGRGGGWTTIEVSSTCAGLLAVVFGLRALRVIDADPSQRGAGRAWFGILVGGLMAALQSGLVLLYFLTKH